jgi:hypothetical protein
MMVGIAVSDQDNFASAESECASTFPPCGCAPGPDVAEDGNTAEYGTADIEVACQDGACMSYVPGGQCALESESCTQQSCCHGLMCCSGVPVPPGGEYCSTMCPISDHDAKENFQPVQSEAVLEGVLSLPISRWRYKTDGGEVEHMGPMAQDFKAVFGLGESDRCIATVDADGVILAAIQALYRKLDAVSEEQKRLREDNDALQREIVELRGRPSAD